MSTVSRSITAALLALLAFSGLDAASLGARAEDKIVVRAGESAIIERNPKAITDAKADHGTVSTVEQGTAEKVHVLLYLAPAGASQLEDKVQYTVDGRAVTRLVSVRVPSPTLADDDLYGASFRAIFALFILAVLVENGLALLFHWKPFLQTFDSRSVNALVAFVFSLLLVRLFDLDIATTLVNTYSGTGRPSSWTGMLLTALIIAGGSSGVNRVFRAFGFRAQGPEQEPPPQPKLTEAWISVTPIRVEAVGRIDVLIGPPGASAVAGTVSAAAARSQALRWLFRDKGRFPPSGGHVVTPGVSYEIQLVGKKADGSPASSKVWGPYSIGPRAIVDIELKI